MANTYAYSLSTSAPVTVPNSKLYGPKQIIVAAVSGLIGTGFFLFRRYYETGTLGWIDFASAASGIVMLVVVMFFVVRKANREE